MTTRPATAAVELPGTIDASCRQPVLTWYASAVVWLVVGTALALLASVKLHSPYFLADAAWLTFGRVRPAHLNTMVYGWGSMAGIGTALWLQARLAKNVLPYRSVLTVFAYYWNVAVAYGTYAIMRGRSSGIEWLEFPGAAAVPLCAAFAVLFAASFEMLRRRRVRHIYVAQWYLFGSMFWFPFLYGAAMLLLFAAPAWGMTQGVANWWFAHNVLGLWLTPIGLASAYYMIPKILGRPIHSYYLSIFGFWTLALFYNWAGTHHLIGGPLPAWLVTVGIVGSMMMFVPVVTVAINHHMTMIGHFHRLRRSPALRFTVFGAMAYTVVSVQGSLSALRTVNQTTHFTHYTIAHAHLGVYAFFTMMMFGAMYDIVPRLTGRQWCSVPLVETHFWCSAVGVIIYFVALTCGGWLQGRMVNAPDTPFLAIVRFTMPFLQWRSAAGTLMAIGHLAFAALLSAMLGGWGPSRETPRAPLPPGPRPQAAVAP